MHDGHDPARETAHYAALDRHALVMAIWLPLGFMAVALFVHGYRAIAPWVVVGGFAMVITGFLAHVIVNAVSATVFTPRERALGLLLYALALAWFLFSLLLGAASAEALFGAFGGGFVVLAVVVVFYMVTRFGVRRAFEAFDVIRDFRPRGESTEPGSAPTSGHPE